MVISSSIIVCLVVSASNLKISSGGGTLGKWCVCVCVCVCGWVGGWAGGYECYNLGTETLS